MPDAVGAEGAPQGRSIEDRTTAPKARCGGRRPPAPAGRFNEQAPDHDLAHFLPKNI